MKRHRRILKVRLQPPVGLEHHVLNDVTDVDPLLNPPVEPQLYQPADGGPVPVQQLVDCIGISAPRSIQQLLGLFTLRPDRLRHIQLPGPGASTQCRLLNAVYLERQGASHWFREGWFPAKNRPRARCRAPIWSKVDGMGLLIAIDRAFAARTQYRPARRPGSPEPGKEYQPGATRRYTSWACSIQRCFSTGPAIPISRSSVTGSRSPVTSIAARNSSIADLSASLTCLTVASTP